MKIESLHELNSVVHGEEEKVRQAGSGASTFGHLLDQEMTAVHTDSGSRVPDDFGLGTLGQTGNSRGKEAEGTMSLLQPFTGVLERLDNMCSHNGGAREDLETLAKALMDLDQAAEELLRGSRPSAKDHLARRLAEEARVLAYVESVKWRRGDYL